jgi:hypothetical protein
VLCSTEKVRISDHNNYEESLKNASFEMLYGRWCWTPMFWNKAGELKFLDPTHCKKVKDKYVW